MSAANLAVKLPDAEAYMAVAANGRNGGHQVVLMNDAVLASHKCSEEVDPPLVTRVGLQGGHHIAESSHSVHGGHQGRLFKRFRLDRVFNDWQ